MGVTAKRAAIDCCLPIRDRWACLRMTRALRLEFEGALDHICARGTRRGAIFEDDRDRIRFLKLIEQSLARYEVDLRPYVLLRNHFHFLGAQTPGPAINIKKKFLRKILTRFGGVL